MHDHRIRPIAHSRDPLRAPRGRRVARPLGVGKVGLGAVSEELGHHHRTARLLHFGRDRAFRLRRRHDRPIVDEPSRRRRRQPIGHRAAEGLLRGRGPPHHVAPVATLAAGRDDPGVIPRSLVDCIPAQRHGPALHVARRWPERGHEIVGQVEGDLGRVVAGYAMRAEQGRIRRHPLGIARVRPLPVGTAIAAMNAPGFR